MKKHKIKIDSALCIGCKSCVRDCPAANIKIVGGKAQPLGNSCIMCGHCAAVCPAGAVSISGFADEPVDMKPDARLNADEVLDVVRFRRSVRQFKADPIPDGVLDKIIEAGRLTHTGANRQDVGFVVLRDKKSEAEALACQVFRSGKKFIDPFSSLARRLTIGDDFFFFKAPAVIVVTADSAVNGALAAASMELVAEAQGLGVLYSGFFAIAAKHSAKLRKLLGVSYPRKVVAALVLGYPAVKYLRSAPREPARVTWL
jgi:nitroreductase/NAD-dependent dihydropyrimidine dehydrogenase PreA subunit